MIGIVTNYILGLKYLRGLRGELKEMKDTVLILCGIFWGAPVYLLMYAIFKEIRDKDFENNRRLLISQIIILVVEVIILIVLGVLGYLKLPDFVVPEENTLIFFFSNIL